MFTAIGFGSQIWVGQSLVLGFKNDRKQYTTSGINKGGTTRYFTFFGKSTIIEDDSPKMKTLRKVTMSRKGSFCRIDYRGKHHKNALQ